MEPKLILFDLDGTLAPCDQDVLYEDAAKWIEDATAPWMVVSNQGSIGLRYWMETEGFGDPTKWQTLEGFSKRCAKLFPGISPSEYRFHILMCTAYQSKTSGKWAPTPPNSEGFSMWRHDWRKPAPGMLLHAMKVYGATPEETLMVGDSNDDLGAATAAGCQFMPDWEFFGRPVPKGGLR
jgi:HAD superfamily hydrolase (TIGR01662 family)